MIKNKLVRSVLDFNEFTTKQEKLMDGFGIIRIVHKPHPLKSTLWML